MSIRLNLRLDQCEFVIAALEYITGRCDEVIGSNASSQIEKFSAHRTKERADEIVAEIQDLL